MLRRVAAALILLLAAVLRLRGLGESPLDSGELTAVAVARAPASAFLTGVRSASGATPVSPALIRLAAEYGADELHLRLPAALAGVVTVALAMLFLRSLFGARAALAAGLLLAAAPLPVSSARLVSALPLAAAASILAAWLLWRLMRDERRLWATAAAAGAALYGGYAGLAVLAAALAAAALGVVLGRVSRAAASRVLAAAAIALFLFSPWGAYDLPTEPGGQFISPNVSWSLIAGLFSTPFAGLDAAAGLGAVVAALALLGIVVAGLRRPSAALYGVALAALVLAGCLLSAWLAPYVFSPAQILVPIVVVFGFAGFGLDQIVRRIPAPSLWTPLCLVLPALLAWKAAAQPVAPASEDWRAAFGVVLQNVGREDLVAVPLAREASAFYGAELERRMPRRASVASIYNWMIRADRSWLIAGAPARFDPQWGKQWKRLTDHGFPINLSPSAEPAVFFFGPERRRAYIEACHFELPAIVLAQQPLLRDCLRELGTMRGPLRQVGTIVDSTGISLRNPTLLESVTLLAQAAHPEEAWALADAISRREPDLAGAAQAALRAGTPPTSE